MLRVSPEGRDKIGDDAHQLQAFLGDQIAKVLVNRALEFTILGGRTHLDISVEEAHPIPPHRGSFIYHAEPEVNEKSLLPGASEANPD